MVLDAERFYSRFLRRFAQHIHAHAVDNSFRFHLLMQRMYAMYYLLSLREQQIKTANWACVQVSLAWIVGELMITQMALVSSGLLMPSWSSVDRPQTCRPKTSSRSNIQL